MHTKSNSGSIKNKQGNTPRGRRPRGSQNKAFLLIVSLILISVSFLVGALASYIVSLGQVNAHKTAKLPIAETTSSPNFSSNAQNPQLPDSGALTPPPAPAQNTNILSKFFPQKPSLPANSPLAVPSVPNTPPVAVVIPREPISGRLDVTFKNVDQEMAAIPQKTIALTFDDGPSPEYTLQVLAKLRQRHLRATFFLVGYRVEARCDLVRQIVSEGHELGNHTFNHPFLTDLSPEQQSREIADTQEAIGKCVGKAYEPQWFRPPYGDTNKATFEIIQDLKLSSIVWSIDTNDWRKTSTSQTIADQILKSHGQDVILMHDATEANRKFKSPDAAPTRNATVGALDIFLDKMIAENIKFTNLSDAFSSKAIAQSLDQVNFHLEGSFRSYDNALIPEAR